MTGTLFLYNNLIFSIPGQLYINIIQWESKLPYDVIQIYVRRWEGNWFESQPKPCINVISCTFSWYVRYVTLKVRVGWMPWPKNCATLIMYFQIKSCQRKYEFMVISFESPGQLSSKLILRGYLKNRNLSYLEETLVINYL